MHFERQNCLSKCIKLSSFFFQKKICMPTLPKISDTLIFLFGLEIEPLDDEVCEWPEEIDLDLHCLIWLICVDV